LIEENILDQLQQGDELAIPQTYHFKPEGFGHFYTCIYPQSIPDEDKHLTALRRELHQQFAIPSLRPVFRRANNYQFDIANSSLLVNPHVGLKSTVTGGKQSLVQGKYTYHHYMQDKFNDDGWGCAYRSLQTLCSWFRLQGYSDHQIPSHEAIQKYLVKVGDKPKTFINSRQWIGSTEVSMCLNGFMNVDSKIMHVSSGAELASKGSELAYHFESQGTPIMIGGGVLAHTILGVDFNSNTGELKFLILDPHFTGADDLQVVQNKGWCGWKGTNFWDKTSYYNLCMPQKPMIF
jgi:Ufm1-specific protease 2